MVSNDWYLISKTQKNPKKNLFDFNSKLQQSSKYVLKSLKLLFC